jgi:peptidoglycan biosynthesis protein MviN/MurJ (putative lipid II flippase)
MIAMADMRDPVAAAVLLLGVLVLVTVRSSRARGKHQWTLAAAAFLGGPVMAVMFWALYAFTATEYVNNKERFDDLWPILVIGGVVGIAAACAITIGNAVRRMTSVRGREQEHTR